MSVTVDHLGLLLEVLSKDKRGYVLVVSEITGNISRIHTFDDYSTILSTKNVYKISYEVKRVGNGCTQTYNVLKGKPVLIGSVSDTGIHGVRLSGKVWDWFVKRGLTTLIKDQVVSTDLMESSARQYLNDPSRYRRHDEKDVWKGRHRVVADVESLYSGTSQSGTQYFPTYNPKYDPTSSESFIETGINTAVTDNMEKIVRRYRTKAQYLTISGKLKDSQLTTVAKRVSGDTSITVNSFKTSKITAYVDALFAQVAFRERHVVEFYLYFAIMTYMKRSRRHPVASVSDVEAFLKAFLTERVHLTGKGALKRLQRVGMAEIEAGKIRLLKQATYVRKWEKAWNAKTIKGRRPKLLYKDVRGVTPIGLVGYDGQRLPWDIEMSLNEIFRPYFDMFFAKTTKVDTGFVHLLNAPVPEMRKFLYELILSAWGDQPVSRIRIAMNLLVSPNTQRHYERCNKFFMKRYNHIEIPSDMRKQLTVDGQNGIQNALATGGKFKISASGNLYRQEGNSYKSSRIKWKSSDKCSRLRLSPRIVKLWKAMLPSFIQMHRNGEEVYSEAFFSPLNEDISKGQSLSTTYVYKKSGMKRGKYFALKSDGVGVVSTDPQNWATFEPLMRYDRRNGDVLVPLAPSLPQMSTANLRRNPATFHSRNAGRFPEADYFRNSRKILTNKEKSAVPTSNQNCY